MLNIYWPVYKNIERQFSELMFDIHVDDNQLDVYSLKISDLILRAAVEIESISKDLYILNSDNPTPQIKYDEAIKHLNQLWNLEKKAIIISSTNCFLTKRIIYPFVKSEQRTGSQRMTFGWNNSYQNLKHDRAKSLKFASLKYLFEIMAALYTLNIYFKDERFDLGRDSKATTFPNNLGSDIFSISLHKWFKYDSNWVYGKKEDYDECIYLTKMTDKSIAESKRVNEELHGRQLERFYNHPKFLKYISENDISKYKGNDLMRDVLGHDDYIAVFKQSLTKEFNTVHNKTEYEAILNKDNKLT